MTALLLASPYLNTTTFASETNVTPVHTKIEKTSTDTKSTKEIVKKIATYLLGHALAVGGVVVVGSLVYVGYKYVTDIKYPVILDLESGVNADNRSGKLKKTIFEYRENRKNFILISKVTENEYKVEYFVFNENELKITESVVKKIELDNILNIACKGKATQSGVYAGNEESFRQISVLQPIRSVTRTDIETSIGPNRYTLVSNTEVLTIEDYEKKYVSFGSSFRNLRNCSLEKNKSHLLNETFIVSVMERRFAHLQQVKYCIEFFIEKISDEKLIKEVLEKKIIKYRKNIADLEAGKFDKFFETDRIEREVTKIKNSIEAFEQVITSGISVFKKLKLIELYDLVDNLSKSLIKHPNEISNLKLSDELVMEINNIAEGPNEYVRGTKYIMSMGESCEPFMLTLHEKTDRIIAMLEYYAKDGNNDNHTIEDFCLRILFGLDREGHVGLLPPVEKFSCSSLPASITLPNPYR